MTVKLGEAKRGWGGGGGNGGMCDIFRPDVK